MIKLISEYVWHDALGHLRSKTRIVDYQDTQNRAYQKAKNDKKRKFDILDMFDEWNFDGSSTGQAEGRTSDVVLKPVVVFKDPFRRDWRNAHCYLVWCETYNIDGTQHPTNNRAKCMEVCEKTKEFEPWFGIEQEYFVFEKDCSGNGEKPYGWIHNILPSTKFPHQEQKEYTTSPVCKPDVKPYISGPNYCGVGGDRVAIRPIMEEHMELCLYAGVKICGINLEVANGQGEFQIGICSAYEVGDHLWISRYILDRVAEKYNAHIILHPKPLGQLPFNGSGGHVNFSTKEIRENKEKLLEACTKLSQKHAEHMEEYGVPEENQMRMTGMHETSSFDKFVFNQKTPSNRGQSLRLPPIGGYLEDRRPASNADPYRVVTIILQTVCLDEK